MKLGLINDNHPARIEADAVIDLASALPEIMALPSFLRLPAVIAEWQTYRRRIDAVDSARQPLAAVRLRAPLPRPAKLLCGQLSFREGVATAQPPPRFFLKSSTSVIGPGDTVSLPLVDAAVFHHEAELAVVIGKRAKDITPEQAAHHIFGYTCFMDMSARGLGPGVGYQDKSYDTFGPMGPWILTADEIADPHALQVRFWMNQELRQDYPMRDIANPIQTMVAYASSVAALEPGDVLAMGVNHQGLGPIEDGQVARIEIAPIGSFEVKISDPLKRRWEPGIDRGVAQAVLRVVRGEPLGEIQFSRRIDR